MVAKPWFDKFRDTSTDSLGLLLKQLWAEMSNKN